MHDLQFASSEPSFGFCQAIFDLDDDIHLVGVGVFAPEAALFGGVVEEDEGGARVLPAQGFEAGEVHASFGDGVHEYEVEALEGLGRAGGDEQPGVALVPFEGGGAFLEGFLIGLVLAGNGRQVAFQGVPLRSPVFGNMLLLNGEGGLGSQADRSIFSMVARVLSLFTLLNPPNPLSLAL